MRRLLLLLLLASVLAGCGTVTAVSLPPAHAATPQHADLNWVESIGDKSGRVLFRVKSFDVTKDGWRADVSVTNDTNVAFAIPGSGLPGPVTVTGGDGLDFGLMLFATGAHSELETRNANRSLPTARTAETYLPALPAKLGAHRTWAGTISAGGPLAAGSWARIAFGALFPVLQPDGKTTSQLPEALRKVPYLAWITDHAYELKLKD